MIQQLQNASNDRRMTARINHGGYRISARGRTGERGHTFPTRSDNDLEAGLSRRRHTRQ